MLVTNPVCFPLFSILFMLCFVGPKTKPDLKEGSMIILASILCFFFELV
jgi:hypothetical protein